MTRSSTFNGGGGNDRATNLSIGTFNGEDDDDRAVTVGDFGTFNGGAGSNCYQSLAAGGTVIDAIRCASEALAVSRLSGGAGLQ